MVDNPITQQKQNQSTRRVVCENASHTRVHLTLPTTYPYIAGNINYFCVVK